MPRKKQVTYLPSDNRYDKPFKYLRKHDAYLVTLQTQTARLPEMLDVVPGHGDRALPKGLVVQWRSHPNYRAFAYKPGHAADVDDVVELGDSGSLDEVITAILTY
jgi:hypothetical protein